jgi:flagellar motor switch protein FliN/FliY
MADEREFGVNSDGSRSEMEAVLDVKVEVSAILGTAEMPISQILKLGRGAVVELERSVGEDIEIYANNQLIAKGEIIVVDDRLGFTVTDVIKSPSG